MITFLNENSTLRISILETLSTSARTGTVWPETKPVYGSETTHANGPDLHQQQQKYFSRFNVTGC